MGAWYARGPGVVPCVLLGFEVNIAFSINSPGLRGTMRDFEQ